MGLDTRAVGQTAVRVTKVSFGCASIGNLYRAVNDEEVRTVLETAWGAGLRYFDTAPHYGRGLSEVRLGTFLQGKPRDSYAISTKVGRLLSPGPQLAEADGFVSPLPNAVHYDYSGDGIEASLEGSLDRMGTTRADIVYVHDIGTYTHGDENARHMDAFLGSGYDRLVRLKEQGRIRAFGLGVNENQVCLDVMTHCVLDVILLAGRLTLLDRSAEQALVPACQAAGTSLVLGGIFNSGILATGPIDGATYDYAPAPPHILERVRVLQQEAQVRGQSLAEASLAFAVDHPNVASVLVGTASADTLKQNLNLISS